MLSSLWVVPPTRLETVAPHVAFPPSTRKTRIAIQLFRGTPINPWPLQRARPRSSANRPPCSYRPCLHRRPTALIVKSTIHRFFADRAYVDGDGALTRPHLRWMSRPVKIPKPIRGSLARTFCFTFLRHALGLSQTTKGGTPHAIGKGETIVPALAVLLFQPHNKIAFLVPSILIVCLTGDGHRRISVPRAAHSIQSLFPLGKHGWEIHPSRSGARPKSTSKLYNRTISLGKWLFPKISNATTSNWSPWAPTRGPSRT